MREVMRHQPGHTIFRPDALRRYAQSRQQTVLPRFTSPRVFILMWILVALLVASVVAAWFARVPVFASGTAALVSPKEGDRGNSAVVVAFLPQETLSHLRAGQSMFIEAREMRERIRLTVDGVEPEINSPATARVRFALGAASGAVTRPSAVALGRLEGEAAGLPAALYAGGVYRVEVEVGSRRVISLLPGLGRLCGE